MILDEYNSSFITYEISPGLYTFKDIFEVLLSFLQSDYEEYYNAVDIELDDITMENKLVVRPGFIAIRFDEKSFLSTILGFIPCWDYKKYNEYIGQKIVNLSTTNKIHLKCDVFDGSVVNGVRQLIVFSFIFDKPSGYKVFYEPETIHYKKINKAVLITIKFYLEDENNEEVNFNGKTLTFTLQMIRIWNNTFTYIYMSIYIFVYIHLYEFLCMFIFTRVIIDVYIQLYEQLYPCIHTFIQVFIFFWVINELSEIWKR